MTRMNVAKADAGQADSAARQLEHRMVTIRRLAAQCTRESMERAVTEAALAAAGLSRLTADLAAAEALLAAAEESQWGPALTTGDGGASSNHAPAGLGLPDEQTCSPAHDQDVA